MSWKIDRRIYTDVATRSLKGEFAVTLDGRTARTALGAPQMVPSKALAHAMAEEWAAQEGRIRCETMPMVQLANTVVDRVIPEPSAMIDAVMAYAETDLLCYRADGPAELIERQNASWQPLLDWAKETLGARLRVTTGIMPVDQPATALRKLRDVVEDVDAVELASLSQITPATGSLVLGLALVAGRIDAGDACELSQLDEAYQVARWGDDDEAAARRKTLRNDIHAAARFLDLARH